MIFLAAKSGRNGLIPFVGTVLLVLLGIALGQIPLSMVMDQLDMSSASTDFSKYGMNENLGFLLLLLGFVGGFIALWFSLPVLHSRPARSLINASSKIDWHRILISFGLWFLLVSIAELFMFWKSPDVYNLQFEWSRFWPLLLLSLFVLPLQTSLEELFFRGYLLQQIGLLLNNRLIAIVLTSVLFGLMHLSNPEVVKFGMYRMMFYYISFGLLLACTTVLDGRLEIALGMHAANNFYGATILSFSGSALQTPTIFYQEVLNINQMLIMYAAVAFLFFLFFAIKYHWTPQTLFYKALHNYEVP